MRHSIISFVASLVLLISWSLPAFAVPVTYIYKGFDASGSLGGAAFLNVDFTITALADTDNIGSWCCSDGQNTHISTTIDIDGFSTADILTASHSWYTSGTVGLGEDLSDNWMTFVNVAFSNYDLSTSIGPILETGLDVSQFTSVSTSAGTLSLSSSTLDGSFQATVVPLPAAVWLFGSGLLGLSVVARRKVRA